MFYSILTWTRHAQADFSLQVIFMLLLHLNAYHCLIKRQKVGGAQSLSPSPHTVLRSICQRPVDSCLREREKLQLKKGGKWQQCGKMRRKEQKGVQDLVKAAPWQPQKGYGSQSLNVTEDGESGWGKKGGGWRMYGSEQSERVSEEGAGQDTWWTECWLCEVIWRPQKKQSKVCESNCHQLIF